MSKKIAKDSRPCFRCEKASELNQRDGTHTCDACRRHFCSKCYKIHNKYDECFCEHKDKCYVCGEDGFYDYGIKKTICWAHI